MEQMIIDPSLKIEVDYQETDMPRTVKELQPALWLEGNVFCCILGPDKETGIFGSGKTPVQALLNWNLNLSERISNCLPGDEVAEFAAEALRASKMDIN